MRKRASSVRRMKVERGGKALQQALVALLVAAAAVMAQQQAGVRDIPRPRPLGPVLARSSRTFQAVTRAVPLRGSLVINDAAARQLWLLDSTLAGARPLLDSVAVAGVAH